jgi:hypothetical protein
MHALFSNLSDSPSVTFRLPLANPENVFGSRVTELAQQPCTIEELPWPCDISRVYGEQFLDYRLGL